MDVASLKKSELWYIPGPLAQDDILVARPNDIEATERDYLMVRERTFEALENEVREQGKML